MKKVKIFLSIFITTCIFSILGVKADSYLGFAGVKVPAFQGTYTSSSATKTTLSNQYIMKTGATDNITGNERAVLARLKNVTNTYVTVSKSYVQLLNSNSGIGQTTGSYQVELKASKWTASSISFAGM